MQTDPRLCSPEVVRSLQQIFDNIWHRLEARGSKYAFPWDAHASREKIAVLLCRRMNDLFVDAERMEQDILEIFDEFEHAGKSNRRGPSRPKAKRNLPQKRLTRA